VVLPPVLRTPRTLGASLWTGPAGPAIRADRGPCRVSGAPRGTPSVTCPDAYADRMPPRRRPLLPALGLTVALLAGCAGGDDRAEGSPVTEEEAGVLAGLLAENHDRGGADFVVTAPYGEDTVLTLTGEVDLAGGAGRAQAVTSYGDGRADDTRTLFFTDEELWFGEVPGLAAALGAEGLPEASYVRRPVTLGEQAPLVDVLTQVVLNLSAEEPDDAGDFRGAGYTWEGDRSIDGELTQVYASDAGWSVAVDRSTDLLVQYRTPLPGEEFEVTVTLSDHGPREITLPGEGESVDGAAHPEVVAAVGL
jgi:hypothetical protein